MGFDVTFAFSVIFTGVVIVFIVLCLLIAVMVIMGKILGGGNRAGKPAGPAVTPPPPMKPSPARAPERIVADGIGEETVAAIAGAVAAMTGGTGALLSVRKAAAKHEAKAGRSAWSMAGLRENTIPF